MDTKSESTPRHEATDSARETLAEANGAGPRARAVRLVLYTLATVAGLSTAAWLAYRPDASEPVDPARSLGSTATQTASNRLDLHPQPRNLLPLRFADGAGTPTSLAAFHGKVVLFNVWATWCPSCLKEMPTLDHLQMLLGGPDFEVVALSIDQGGEPVVQDFFRQAGIKQLHLYIDQYQEAMTGLGLVALPLTLLIDRQGREIGRKLGPAAWDDPQIVATIRSRLGTTSGALGEAAGRAVIPVGATPPNGN